MTQPRPDRMSGGDVFSYARHQPEHTLIERMRVMEGCLVLTTE